MHTPPVPHPRTAATVAAAAPLAAHDPEPTVANNTALEALAMYWLASGTEVLWLPISGNAFWPIGSYQLLTHFDQLYRLPTNLKGWLYPAHQQDTDMVVQLLADKRLHFSQMGSVGTGRVLTHNSWYRLTRGKAPEVTGGAAAPVASPASAASVPAAAGGLSAVIASDLPAVLKRSLLNHVQQGKPQR